MDLHCHQRNRIHKDLLVLTSVAVQFILKIIDLIMGKEHDALNAGL